MKHTAVEMFATKLMALDITPKQMQYFLQWFEQAKKTEKEQMYEVSKEGIFSKHEFEEYYKETYEKQ